MHFLHGGWSHIVNNSLSFIVLNTMLFYYYKEISTKVFWYIFLFGAILLWIIGRESNHIGASLIIFGEAAFLFFSGVFRDFPKLLRISLFVAFFYGSMVWYIFPVDQHISWEGHLSGAVIGILAAVIFRKQGPKRDKYDFEIEQEQIEAWKLMTDDEIEVVDVREYRNEAPKPNIQFDYRPNKNGKE
jgi:membrane associated rhomboid family serine protease